MDNSRELRFGIGAAHLLACSAAMSAGDHITAVLGFVFGMYWGLVAMFGGR